MSTWRFVAPNPHGYLIAGPLMLMSLAEPVFSRQLLLLVPCFLLGVIHTAWKAWVYSRRKRTLSVAEAIGYFVFNVIILLLFAGLLLGIRQLIGLLF